MRKRKIKGIKTGGLVGTLLFAFAVCAGCGGGGGGGSAAGIAPSTSGATPVYALISPVSRTVGAAPTTIAAGDVTLDAALATTTTVTVTERFYTSGRPLGVIGKIYDIKPDGLAFLAGTRLCISYEGSTYPASELVIVTGENLDQPLATTVDSGRGRVCANLQHSSPYGMRRAMNLKTPADTFFGNLNIDAKEPYRYTVTTSAETDSEIGGLTVTKILVDCNLQCRESGEHTFKVAQGGDYDGALFIRDSGAYPFWTDLSNLKWIYFRNEAGAIVAGIAYLLAAEYIDAYTGGGTMASYISRLDPAENRIQRFFFEEGDIRPYLTIEVIRDDATAPGVVRVIITNEYDITYTYVINRTTAAITKSWNCPSDGPHSVSVSPGDAEYKSINTELLYNFYVLIGLDDTPDYTKGNAWDQYWRHSPNQELFAVNVMNLIKGLGWNNLEAIEMYYRDRLEAIADPAN